MSNMAPIGDNDQNADNDDVVTSEICNDTDSDPAQDIDRDSSTLTSPSVSRHSGRSRSRSRHHHRSHSQSHRHRSRSHFKRKESNFLAAVCSMVVLVLLCTALAEPEWFRMSGGGCRDYDDISVEGLGVNQFFYLGKFIHSTPGEKSHAQTIYQYGSSRRAILKDCVTPQVVSIMKSIISLCFFGVCFSLVAFLMDLSGPTHRLLKLIRRNGVCNILTVAVCIVMNGFCYWATEWLQNFQHKTKLHKGSKVQVQFGISFYLVTAGGAMSVIASACNLLKRHTSHEHDPEQRQRLLDYDELDLNNTGDDNLAQMLNMPPPPPYSP